MSFLKKLNIKKRRTFAKDNLKLHLGCGMDYIPGMVNCDIQRIWGVDLVMNCGDLSEVRSGSVSLIFGHSFFEHLYIYQQEAFLEDCKRVLNDKGVLVLLGIPDFAKVAELYFKKAKAVKPFEGTFDLYQAYRLTHGDFEENEKESIPQMHKALFDKVALIKLLGAYTFSSYVVFNYKPPPEQYRLAIGIVAWKNRNANGKGAIQVLSGFKRHFHDFDNDVKAKLS